MKEELFLSAWRIWRNWHEHEFICLWPEDNQKWIIVDIGVTFADESIPGLIYPDAGFIIDKKDDLLGIVFTHAHEDHIGSIVHIWPKLKCKIFATPFTAVLTKKNLKKKKLILQTILK